MGNPFTSVFDAMWWFILVVTKGDVGDMQPMSTVGRFFGIVTSLIGILITGFIVSAFNESWIQLDKDRRQNLRVDNNVTSTHEDHLAFLHEGITLQGNDDLSASSESTSQRS